VEGSLTCRSATSPRANTLSWPSTLSDGSTWSSEDLTAPGNASAPDQQTNTRAMVRTSQVPHASAGRELLSCPALCSKGKGMLARARGEVFLPFLFEMFRLNGMTVQCAVYLGGVSPASHPTWGLAPVAV